MYEDEVLSLIENLAEGKALQHSDIPAKFIKLSKSMLAPSTVLHMFWVDA